MQITHCSYHKIFYDHFVVVHEVKDSGIRLDAYLKSCYRRRSREKIKSDIVSGRISLIRQQSPHLCVGRLKPSLALLAGDEIHIQNPKRIEPPVDFSYKVLYEDSTLFVIDKPANLPVHPAGRFYYNTLLTHLKTRYSDQQYFLPHRIDRETSGVLVLTKTAESCARITEQFRKRTTQKHYLAIVHGIPKQKHLTVDQPLQRDARSRIRLKMGPCRVDQGGLSAQTEVEHLLSLGNFSLLECRPLTGRQHQIRVHLALLGHPIVGDKIYGLPEIASLALFEGRALNPETEARLLLPRHALHAARLSLEHPLNAKKIEFRSELPSDMQAFLDRLPSR